MVTENERGTIMSAPPFRGLHHLKLPVSDIDASLDWYRRVLGAAHQPQWDHVNDKGVRFAVIISVPGLEQTIELRWAPKAAKAIAGYDPINFAAADGDFPAWVEHLDALGVGHSPLFTGQAGQVLIFPDPDGTYLRILSLAEGGVQAIKLKTGMEELDNPWTAPDIMRHP